MGVVGAAPPHPHTKNVPFSSFDWPSLIVFAGQYLGCVWHQRTVRSHDLTYIGDPIPVTFDTSGCQSSSNIERF